MTHETYRFAQPLFLWLLIVPAGLALLWGVRLLQRRRDIRRLRKSRIIPVPERFRFAGPLAFWGCLLLAVAALVVALAMPQTLTRLDASPVDLIIIQDGSASMRAADVVPTRWKRSMKFLRTLAEALPWKADRMGLAVFANHALPQIRLVRDPNTVIFFIEHLEEEPPFALEENTSWDTNAYEGIRWGLKLIAKDEAYHGKDPNPKAMILLSDGDRFSGETVAAINEARSLGIAIHVIGVGTSSGGFIPEPKAPPVLSEAEKMRYGAELARKRAGIPQERIRSVIDRDSLRKIAALGGGRYFELDTESDAAIASTIIGDVRLLGITPGGQRIYNDIYWRFLWAALLFLAAAVAFRR